MDFKKTHVLNPGKKQTKENARYLTKMAKEVTTPKDSIVVGETSGHKPKGNIKKGDFCYFLGRALFDYKYR